MIERRSKLESQVRQVAIQAIRNYAHGLLTVEALMEQILQEWELLCIDDDQSAQAVLTRLAQRICSRTLYAAWRSEQSDIRDCAYYNLRHYLARSLRNCSYAKMLEESRHATEDVLQQTLEELHLALRRNPLAGPNKSAAFLKWVQTILIRQAHAYVQTCKRHDYASLDAQPETLAEQCIDVHNLDPQEHILAQELQQALVDVILSLRNLRYQQVLLAIYLGGITESELAALMNVDIQEIYMCKHRALKILRNDPALIRRLRALRE